MELQKSIQFLLFTSVTIAIKKAWIDYISYKFITYYTYTHNGCICACAYISNFLTLADDYGSGPYNATFEVGENEAFIFISITNDNFCDRDETFTLEIDPNSLPTGVLRDNPYETTVTIKDDECKW